MLDHIGISVKNYALSKAFYEKALHAINYELILEVQGFAGFGCKGDSGPIATFWVHENMENVSNGVHIAFHAKTREQVDSFYRDALAAGGIDNGAPGIRKIYHPNYYGAFVLDPDGNNIEVVCHDVAHKNRAAEIVRSIVVPASKQEAYSLFLDKFSSWWPKEYTWSQDKLVSIVIEPKQNGRCYEIGPNGFDCQFGTVLSVKPNELLTLAWQIDPNGKPQPDLEKCSELAICFKSQSEQETIVELKHKHIDRHGKDSKRYFDEFSSEYGWDYVLKKFMDFIVSQSKKSKI